MRTRGDSRLAKEESRLVIMQTGARRSKARKMQQEGKNKVQTGIDNNGSKRIDQFLTQRDQGSIYGLGSAWWQLNRIMYG